MAKKSALNVKAKKPKATLFTKVKVNYSALFKAVFKGSIALATYDWASMVTMVADGVAAVRLAKSVEELTYTLVQRSILKAMIEVVGETGVRALVAEDGRTETMYGAIDKELEGHEVVVNHAFFDRPMELEILPMLQATLRRWLIAYGTTEVAAETMARRLPTFFQAALMEEWRENANAYGAILEALKSPFAKAADRELGWKNYNAHLQKLVESSVFDEPFSLAQIYVPLNAYYLKEAQKGELEPEERTDRLEKKPKLIRHVVCLEEELTAWVTQPNKEGALRILSGGPGSGKSSFAKVFAAKMSLRDDLKVLLIELHKLDATKDLPTEVERYARDEGFLSGDPLASDSPEPSLLIILDGLDELAHQGRAAVEAARVFVHEVQRTLERKNGQKLWLRILLSGRELTIQENESEFRSARQVLNLLPYHISKEERESKGDQQYSDLGKRLEKDLRQAWWKRYGELTGKEDLTGLPQVLEKDLLNEVTAQPLLNYLVALTYTRGKVKFDESVNLNEVYGDLVNAVYERGYERNKPHAAISRLTRDEFTRALEEVALAAWHGDGRSTTVREIEQHCESSGQGNLLKKFQEGASAGVTRLLAAFFFRQHGERSGNGDKTFIFTHKSFGEYLAARRVVRAADLTVKKLMEREVSSDDGWSEREALERWLFICGPSACTAYIQTFIRDEFRLRGAKSLQKYQEILSRLFRYVLSRGSPIEKLTLQDFFTVCKAVNNAETCLLVVLNAVCQVTEVRGMISVGENRSSLFGAWFQRVQSGCVDGHVSVAARSLSHLSLTNCNLQACNFAQCDLSDSDLTNSNFWGTQLFAAQLDNTLLVSTYLVQADLSFTSLDHANLSGANLNRANLNGAHLREANLIDTDLTEANLSMVNLSFANLTGANLTGADLSDANLCAADLSSADLTGSYLNGANLKEADLSFANLSYADLSSADLSAAELIETNLSGSNLRETNLSEANLNFANLSEADLHRACLTEANLREADLSETTLGEADLTRADLCGADLTRAHLWGANISEADFRTAIYDPEQLKHASSSDRLIL